MNFIDPNRIEKCIAIAIRNKSWYMKIDFNTDCGRKLVILTSNIINCFSTLLLSSGQLTQGISYFYFCLTPTYTSLFIVLNVKWLVKYLNQYNTHLNAAFHAKIHFFPVWTIKKTFTKTNVKVLMTKSLQRSHPVMIAVLFLSEQEIHASITHPFFFYLII